MSKKSTWRTESDGEAEYSSTNGHSSNSDKSTCNTQPHLSDKQEPKKKFLTPILQSNHAGTVQALNHKFSPDYQSYEMSAYSINDEFNRNLESLRQRLDRLNVYESSSKVKIQEPLTSQNTQQWLDAPFDTHSSNTESSCDSKSDYKEKPKGYVSTKKAYINLLSSSPMCKKNENLKIELDCSILNAIQFSDSDSSISGDSTYTVPLKKWCKEKKVIAQTHWTTLSPKCFTGQPQNKSTLVTSTSKSENVSKEISPSLPTPIKKQCVRSFPKCSTGQPQNKSTLETSIPKSENISKEISPCLPTPIKRRCVRSLTPLFVNNFPKLENKLSISSICMQSGGASDQMEETSRIYIKPPGEGDDEASWKTKSQSAFSSDLDLGLNLPSSIVGEYTSSSKTTPLEPNIIITDKQCKKSKFKRKNKIATFSDSPYSTTPSSSIDKENLMQQLALHKKYYEDTSEISSNLSSTPSLKISTCASQNSSYPSATTEVSTTKIQPEFACETFKKNLEAKTVQDKNPEVKIYDPVLNTSLDVPKMFMHVYNFPAVTKMTLVCGSLTTDLSSGDFFNEEMSENEDFRLNSIHTYKNKAEPLLNSPTKSPIREKSHHESAERGDSISVDSKTKRPIVRDFTSNRKGQSTKMSFYSVPSTALNEDLSDTNFRLENEYYSETSIDEAETCATCCCYNFFFPKMEKKFFT